VITYVFNRIAKLKVTRLDELLPWSCAAPAEQSEIGLTRQSTFAGRSP
jgi:hypothetical protein